MEEYRQSDELQQSTVLCLFLKLASQRSWARFGLWDQISFRIDAVTPEELPNRRFEVKFHISGNGVNQDFGVNGRLLCQKVSVSCVR